MARPVRVLTGARGGAQAARARMREMLFNAETPLTPEVRPWAALQAPGMGAAPKKNVGHLTESEPCIWAAKGRGMPRCSAQL